MKCKDIIEKLEKISPSSYALDWDNVGLLVGDSDREIKKILVTLDCNNEAVNYGLNNQVQMIVSHHPVIFRGIKSINAADALGKRLMTLIGNNICGYSMHTNFDVCLMGKLAGERLGLKDMIPLDVTGQDEKGQPCGVGVVGKYSESKTMEWWCRKVKEVFDIPFVSFYGKSDDMTDTVAVCPGSGKEYALQSKLLGAKILITGDVTHHPGIDAVDDSMNICDATHYGIEYIFVEYISKYLKECFGECIEVIGMPKHSPAEIY